MISLKSLIKSAKQIKVVTQKKTPKSQERYVGIEVEMVSPLSKDMFAFLISQAGLTKWVNVGTDGSIETDDYGYSDDEEDDTDATYGLECRILCKEKELKQVLPKFFQLALGAGCYVNESCGLHVHLDARNRNFMNMAKNLYAAQELLYSVVDSERRGNSYCYPLHYSSYNNFVATGGSTANLRRTGINLTSYNKHRTVEIRIHHGSLNYIDVMSWVRMLITIVNLRSPVDSWDLYEGKYFLPFISTWIKRKVKRYGTCTISEPAFASSY